MEITLLSTSRESFPPELITLHRVHLGWAFRNLFVLRNALGKRSAELFNALRIRRKIADEGSSTGVPTHGKIFLSEIWWKTALNLHKIGSPFYSRLGI